MLKNLSKKTKFIAFSTMFVATTAIAASVVHNHEQMTADSKFQSDNLEANFAVAEAEVTNEHDGLVWQSCLVGQTFANGTCTGEPTQFASWADATNSVTTQQQADGWRVPSIKELMRVTDNTRAYPAVNKEVFAFAKTLSYQEDDSYQNRFVNDSSFFVWSSTPAGLTTTREIAWNPALKTESAEKTAEEKTTIDKTWALDMGYGQPQTVTRADGKNTKYSGGGSEKARYVLLVKDAS